jgi:hypothetical protein
MSFAGEAFILILYCIIVMICYHIPSQRDCADVLRSRTFYYHYLLYHYLLYYCYYLLLYITEGVT